MATTTTDTILKQYGALPFAVAGNGAIRVMLM